jgi:transketolase C-terminal domain/subunit
MANEFNLSSEQIPARAKQIRRKIIRTNVHAGQGHTAADLSEADILAALYLRILDTGKDLTVFAVGSTVFEAAYAADELASAGISVEVVNISSVRPLDRQQIIESASKTSKVITVEEHSVHGGIGSIVSEVIAEEGLAAKVTRLGITEGQFAKAGPRKEIRAFYKID